MLPLTAYRTLSLAQQVTYLRAAGRLLATRQEGGVRQQLYDLWGFFVEVWSWTDDGAAGLIHSFSDPRCLESWVAHVQVPSGS